MWKIDSNGMKVPTTKKLTVHNDVSDVLVLIFDEIFNDPERFPIDNATTGSYSDRGNTSSLHNYGLAVDINWNANAMFNSNGTIRAGTHYSPGVDPLSIPAGGSVVRAFENHGWYWGGNWNSSKDYMHFAYMNH